MSKQKTLNVEKQPVSNEKASEQPNAQMTEAQLQQVMRHDMDMIRLRASVLELKSMKWRLLKEMAETEISGDTVLNEELLNKVSEEMKSLAESTFNITA